MKRKQADRVIEALRAQMHDRLAREDPRKSDEADQPEQKLIAAVEAHVWIKFGKQHPANGQLVLYWPFDRKPTAREYVEHADPAWRRFRDNVTGHFYVASPRDKWMEIPT